MKGYSKRLVLFLLASFLTPAWAHTGLAHTHSFVTGFMHPWSGFDHLLVMFAVGLYAGTFKGRPTLSIPISFLLFMAFGAGAAYLDIALPAAGQGIVFSLFIVGALLIVKTQLSRIISIPLIAYFALCHGYAHAIEMDTGENGRLYLSGFVLSTALLLSLGMLASKPSTKRPNYLRVLTGMASIAVGALALAY